MFQEIVELLVLLGLVVVLLLFNCNQENVKKCFRYKRNQSLTIRSVKSFALLQKSVQAQAGRHFLGSNRSDARDDTIYA